MKPKLLVSSIALALILSTLFYFAVQFVSAETADTAQGLQDKIGEYEQKLEEISGRKKSLSNEIEYMDGQINLTQLRIQNSISNIASTEQDIKNLVRDISDLAVRITKLQRSIDHQRSVMNARLRERYKTGETSPIVVLFGTPTINALIQKTEYLKVMELQDTKMLDEMDRTKRSYDLQKSIFEEKKEEEEVLKKKLEVEKANLDAYKASLEDKNEEKKRLLEVTENDEQKYQKLLEEAQKELRQIVGAAEALKNETAKHVEKGELIGIQGNTGYSFGDHLHFGVYKYDSLADIVGWDWYYSNYVDPSKKLKNKTVYWNTGCESPRNKAVGSGDWSWPMSSPTVSQGFGHTCWSDVYYGGNVHPAFDMYGPRGTPVYAVADGDAYFCRNCLGDGGNGVFVFHEDGYMTVYWHLQ